MRLTEPLKELIYDTIIECILGSYGLPVLFDKKTRYLMKPGIRLDDVETAVFRGLREVNYTLAIREEYRSKKLKESRKGGTDEKE